jgi:hypothetical protein
MLCEPWFGSVKSASSPRRGPNARGSCSRSRAAHSGLTFERLEDRRLLSPGVTPSLVKLGGATPLPIPSVPAPGVLPNTLGGPDNYINLPGPVDSTTPGFGGELNVINDFKGFIATARVQGTGTDGNGNTLLWDADMRVMRGVYEAKDGRLHRGTFAEV